jgi:hypothetical protein
MPPQLPEELLDRIIYYAAAWHPSYNSWISQRYRETLLSICLAFKTLCRLARPHLYKGYSNHAEKREYYWTGMGLNQPHAVKASFPPTLHEISSRYARTLCAKPNYGRMLASLSISLEDHQFCRASQHVSCAEQLDLVFFLKRAQHFWFGIGTGHFVASLQQDLLSRTPHATACMMLLMCPNIKTLEIIGDRMIREPTFTDSSLAYLLELGTASTPEPGDHVSRMSSSEAHVSTRLPVLQKDLILQHVRNLTLDADDDRLTLAQARGIFSLPMLGALRINRLLAIDGIGLEVRGTTLDWPRCKQLKEFVLHRSSLPGSHIPELLRLSPNLTKLELSWTSDVDMENQEPDFQEIGTAISKYTPLVTSLKLDDESADYYVLQSTRLRYTLRDLQHLTCMSLSCSSLWCHPSEHVDAINDNLPSCIETLHIFEWDPMRDTLSTDDSSLGKGPDFDAACDTDAMHDDDDENRCRTRDIRRLLLDERLVRLRRVIFDDKDVDDGGESKSDPHVLRHIWTAAVRRRGWKMLENVSPPIRRRFEDGGRYSSHHEAVLYRELADAL